MPTLAEWRQLFPQIDVWPTGLHAATNSTTEETMGFFTQIGTFAHQVEQEIAHLWGKAPAVTTVAAVAVTYVGPLLETVIEIEGGPEAAAEATAVINQVETYLLAARGLMDKIGPTVSVAGLFKLAVANLQMLLTTAHVKNELSRTNITTVITEIAHVADVVIAAIPTPKLPAAMQPAADASPAQK